MSEYSRDYTIDELIVVLMAREVRNDDVMVIGVSEPIAWAAFTLAKLTHAPDASFHFIMGTIYTHEPRQVSLLYHEMNCARAYKFQNTCENVLELLPSDRLTTIEFFRPAQIDQYGNTNNICIGDWRHPKVRLPGAAGIPDFSMLYGRGQFLYTPRHDTRTFVPTEQMSFISGAGFTNGKQNICGGAGPQCVITNLAYLTFDNPSKRMQIGSIHPDVDLEEIKNSTGFELIIQDELKETIPPTSREIELLRKEIDPLGIRKLEVLAGKEREYLLDKIITEELKQKKKMPKLLTPSYSIIK